MARIVVTGATGFIGTRLVSLLRESGHDVTVMLHLNEPDRDCFSGLPHLRADVTQPHTLTGKFDGFDKVFHLAGCTIARHPDDFYRVNREGTRNVAESCAASATPPQLVFVSSLAASGAARNGQPTRETVTPAPVSHYGKSKYQAEQVLRELADSLPIQIVRPPSVIGEDDPYMLSLFKAAKLGWVVMPGWSTYQYSMIHVDDLVRAIPHVAECRQVRISDSDSGIVNLAQVPALSFPDTAQIVREHFGGRRVRKVHLPASLCWTVAAANSFAARMLPVRPLLNLDKIREGLAGEWIADPTRLTEELGFRFPNSIHVRIAQTAEGYHKKGWL